MTNRRSALRWMTGGVATLGALFVGGGLLRSCGPDAEVRAQERGVHVAFPEVDYAWVPILGVPYHVRRIVPEMRAAMAATPPGPDPYLRRDGVAQNGVEATVDTVLQGPERDLLILAMQPASLGGFIPDSGDWADQGGFFEHRSTAQYDGLGRVQKVSFDNERNLFSPRLFFVDGQAYVRPGQFDPGQPV